MLNRLLKMISILDLMKNDDWRDRIKERNIIRFKIIGVLFAFVIAGCLLVRIIT